MTLQCWQVNNDENDIDYTLIPQEFKKFVIDGVRKSETMNIKKKAMEIDVWEEFAKMFKTSESFSNKIFIY